MLENSEASRLTYEAARQYVKDKYPQYESFFDVIWTTSISKSTGTKKAFPKDHFDGLHFAGDDALQLIVNAVVPFLSGVISSILAEALYQKVILNEKETAKIVEDKAKKIRINIKVDKELASELVPYIFRTIARKKRNRRNASYVPSKKSSRK